MYAGITGQKTAAPSQNPHLPRCPAPRQNAIFVPLSGGAEGFCFPVFFPLPFVFVLSCARIGLYVKKLLLDMEKLNL